ncbi:multiple epidermal growth factor-like domains protein 6 [Liolophura sinensis]|uniref:multiple epidermal growth factor-like domains protein 6 n=1 Tax=Liolophura sinensis TaxID=3198878 RepID=UPI0031596D43
MAETSRQTYFLVVLSCILFVSVNGECPADKFGDECQFECHCSNGVCEQKSGHCPKGCALGWSGPSCQKQNIALKRRATQSSTFCEPTGRCFNASYSVDGSRDQWLYAGSGCSHTQSSSYNEWRVSWSEEHYITNLVIYNRKDCCQEDLNGFRVYVQQRNGTRVLCYNDPTSQPIRDVIHVRCDAPVLGTSVTITLSGGDDVNLTLCEVEVYVCAAGWYGDHCENQCTGPQCQQCDPTGTYCQDCAVGRFGKDCLGLCHCYDGVACQREGSCPGKGKKLCARGWTGSSCSTGKSLTHHLQNNPYLIFLTF